MGNNLRVAPDAKEQIQTYRWGGSIIVNMAVTE